MKRKRLCPSRFDVYVDQVDVILQMMFIPDVAQMVTSYLPPPGHLDFYDPKSTSPLAANEVLGAFRFGYKHMTTKSTKNSKYTLTIYNSKFEVDHVITICGKVCNRSITVSGRCSNSKYLFYLHTDGQNISVYNFQTKYVSKLHVSLLCGEMAATESHLYMLSGTKMCILDLARLEMQTETCKWWWNRERYVEFNDTMIPIEIIVTPPHLFQIYATSTSLFSVSWGMLGIDIWRPDGSHARLWHAEKSLKPTLIRIIGFYNDTIYFLFNDRIISVDLNTAKEITHNVLPPGFDVDKHKMGICGDALWVLNETTRTSFLLS